MQLGTAEHQEAFKQQYLKDLYEGAWKDKISARRVFGGIEKIETLKAQAAKETAECEAQLAQLDPNDKTKTTRATRKELEKKIENGHRGLAYCDKKIDETRDQVNTFLENAASQLQRAEFIEANFPAVLDWKMPEEKAPEVVEPAKEEATA